jgi:tight adherence protein C
MAATFAPGRRVVPGIGDFLSGPAELGRFHQRLGEPFAARMGHMVGERVADRIEGLLPRARLDKIERQLVQAGLEGRRRVGTQLATQLGLVLVLSVVAVLLWQVSLSPMTRRSALLLPAIGVMLPAARLKRRIRKRNDTIFKDLPDIIDMLAVAVEAGCGFDAALSIVCQHFDSPMADELRLALQGMELGMPRREVLQELKRRTDLDVVRTFMLALIQADGLGIPVGRVLTSQATEIRSRRRAWAREKAAKLPVKIMFPLVMFIFPPIMAIVIGPAMGSFGKL